MRIGELAASTGNSKDTIRYYEKVGLLHPEVRNKQRDYSRQDIEALEEIHRLKQVGFSLQEIKMLMEWSQHTDPTEKLTKAELHNILHIKELFHKKYEQVVQQEAHIRQIKEVLQKAGTKLAKLIEDNKS